MYTQEEIAALNRQFENSTPQQVLHYFMEKMGGEITADNKDGGLLITIHIPLL